MDRSIKIRLAVKDFFDSFGKLTADEKIYFLAALDKEIAKKLPKEKQLYLELIKAAKEGKSLDSAITDIAKIL